MQPDPDVVRRQVERILRSPGFLRSARMRRFLSFSVSETLAGRGELLKEYTVGVAVFDRPPAFDPVAEPIVRVEARRLRAKLEEYYRGPGLHDRILIEIPKGAYAARFRPALRPLLPHRLRLLARGRSPLGRTARRAV